MTVKNFNFAARKQAAKKKPGAKARKDIPFTLEEGGPTYHLRGEIHDESLDAISASFVRAEVNEDKREAGRTQSVALFKMINTLFLDETAQALWARIEDGKDSFGFDALGEVIEWGIEQHSGRPTTSSRT